MKVQFGYTPGQTLTAKRYTETGTTSLQTASGVTASGTVYVATFADTVTAGRYRIAFELAGTEVGYEYYTVVSGYDAAVPILPDSELAVSGGGAFESTLLAVKAKTDLITSQSANMQTTPLRSIVIVRGDSLVTTFAVTTNYTGYTPTLTIRHRVTDAVLLSVATVVVTSATVLTITLTAANTAFALLVSDEEFGAHPFDIELVSGAIRKTESGIAIVSRDQTR